METQLIKIAGASFVAPAIIQQTKAEFVSQSMQNEILFSVYDKKTKESLLKQVYDIAQKLCIK